MTKQITLRPVPYCHIKAGDATSGRESQNQTGDSPHSQCFPQEETKLQSEHICREPRSDPYRLPNLSLPSLWSPEPWLADFVVSLARPLVPKILLPPQIPWILPNVWLWVSASAPISCCRDSAFSEDYARLCSTKLQLFAQEYLLRTCLRNGFLKMGTISTDITWVMRYHTFQEWGPVICM